MTDPRLQSTLEQLMEVPSTDLTNALSSASDVMARVFDADKVDAFLYQAERDSLVAVGSSHQPLSARQRRCGLDVLPVSNGGRVVYVYQTGETFLTGKLDEDPDELRGIKEALAIRSILGMPLHVGGTLRGVLMLASQKREFFDAADAQLAQSVVRWVGVIAHRAELAQEIARNAAEQGRRAVAEELITMLAHDLRNSIAPVELRLRVLDRRLQSAGRDQDSRELDAALTGLRRLSAMIADILDVARIDQGVLALQREPVDLVPLLEQIARELSSPGVEVVIDPSEPVVVLADRVRLRQCIDNVVANAVRHSPPGSGVQLTLCQEARERDVWTRIDIADHGEGITPEFMPRIFDRFVRGSRRGGLGLGLHLAKQIAIVHGGDLTAVSSPGQGARFTLRLPGMLTD